MESKNRSFCVGNSVGIVVEGVYRPVKYDEEIFSSIVDFLKKNIDVVTADVILRKAIMLYTSTLRMARIYKDQRILDSKFYSEWLQRIKADKNFMEKAQQVYKKQQEVTRKKRRESDIRAMCYEARELGYKRRKRVRLTRKYSGHKSNP